MNYFEYLNQIIEFGMAAAHRDYPKDDPRLAGSLVGFMRCKGMPPAEILRLNQEAQAQTMQLRARRAPDAEVWHAIALQTEIEWVLNVLGAGLGMRPLGVPITARGVMTAAKILGFKRIDPGQLTPAGTTDEAQGLQLLLAQMLDGLPLGRCDERILDDTPPSKAAILELLRTAADLSRQVAPLKSYSLNAVLYHLLEHVAALMEQAGCERPEDLAEALRAAGG